MKTFGKGRGGWEKECHEQAVNNVERKMPRGLKGESDGTLNHRVHTTCFFSGRGKNRKPIKHFRGV